MAGAIIMQITYGHRVVAEDDAYVALAEAVRENQTDAPGTHIVDVFPVRECARAVSESKAVMSRVACQ